MFSYTDELFILFVSGLYFTIDTISFIHFLLILITLYVPKKYTTWVEIEKCKLIVVLDFERSAFNANSWKQS